jgi:putative ABC transport system permease protein
VEFDLPVTVEKMADIVPEDTGVAVEEAWLDHQATVAETAVTLNGAPFDTQLYERTRLVDGRWFTASDTNAIILQEKFAADHELDIGDTVSVDVNSNQMRWQVIGIVRDYNESGNAPLVPYTQLASVLELEDHANFILLQLSDRSDAAITTFSQEIDELLPRLGVQGAVFTIDDIREQAEAGFQVIVLFLLAMVILVAFVGGLGLFGTLTINVTERQKEIGVMRSVGATNGAIVKIFWLEGICLGLFGWIIAILIGYPLARLFTQLLSDVLIPVEFYLPPSATILLGVGMLLLVSLSSIMPALSAARSRVSDIIRYA